MEFPELCYLRYDVNECRRRVFFRLFWPTTTSIAGKFAIETKCFVRKKRLDNLN